MCLQFLNLQLFQDKPNRFVNLKLNKSFIFVNFYLLLMTAGCFQPFRKVEDYLQILKSGNLHFSQKASKLQKLVGTELIPINQLFIAFRIISQKRQNHFSLCKQRNQQHGVRDYNQVYYCGMQVLLQGSLLLSMVILSI